MRGWTLLTEPLYVGVGVGEHIVRVVREGYRESERLISLSPGENLARGFGIAAGAFGVATGVVLAIDLARDYGETDAVEIAVVPGSLVLIF